MTPTLTLVDTTQTSSWDDYAQGFRADGVTPNMNCPGQGANSGAIPDLFYFSLYNQPNYLNFYNSQHGGPALTPLPDNSQFKCYDGMHNWNQLQPAPYDGMYKFPSVTAVDANGKPSATNCTICTADTVARDQICTTGIPMLPSENTWWKWLCRQGFELVKEEDKNILIGDNFIAPVTQEFGGLGNIFIIPDQASVAVSAVPWPGYNANNAQNPTTEPGNRLRTKTLSRDLSLSPHGRASAKRALFPTTSAFTRNRSRLLHLPEPPATSATARKLPWATRWVRLPSSTSTPRRTSRRSSPAASPTTTLRNSIRSLRSSARSSLRQTCPSRSRIGQETKSPVSMRITGAPTMA